MSIPPSSHQHTIVAAVLAAGLLAAPSARAQALSSSLDVGIASGSALAGPSPSALLLQPAIRWDHPRTSVSAQASWLASPARSDNSSFMCGCLLRKGLVRGTRGLVDRETG